MSITYRNSGDWGAGKGSKLTSIEADTNFWTLAQLIDDLNSTGGLVSWDSATISGNTLTFHKTDGSTSSVTIPTATPTWRGEFSATSYAAFDWFSESGTIYQVLVAHTGVEPFDAGRVISGQNVYQKILDFPSVPGFEVATDTFTPTIVHANSYIVLTTTGTGGCAVSIDPATEFDDWTELHFRDETAAGVVTFDVSTPGSINPQFGSENISAGKGATVSLKKRGSTDAWDIMGLLVQSTV